MIPDLRKVLCYKNNLYELTLFCRSHLMLCEAIRTFIGSSQTKFNFKSIISPKNHLNGNKGFSFPIQLGIFFLPPKTTQLLFVKFLK